ncbi:MAG: DUF835 domain-containing protein [Candidatus Thermoplasmatota archaeon]|nr:DUF835 domain-containing protein [Candidatus Thermoplasmatota archaeon]
MVDLIWIGSVGAGAICLGAGMLGWMKNPQSKAATVFMLAMIFVFVSMTTSSLFTLIDSDRKDTADSIAKTSLIALLLAQTFLWEIGIVFPVERTIRIKPPNFAGGVMIAGVIIAIALGLLATVDYSHGDTVILDPTGLRIKVAYTATMVILATAFVLHSRDRESEAQQQSGIRYLLGLWIFAISGIPYAIDVLSNSSIDFVHSTLAPVTLVAGTALSGLIFAFSIARGQMVMRTAPVQEAMLSSSKASFKLLHRHVYLIEEEKPNFTFNMFADILKRRCFDCENDDSFPCESIECSTCKLPCPCRECSKYRNRTQGLIITRQFPNDVRSGHFIQTTPIIWLSTVAGNDNMDPAKMSLLTDLLTNFMEKSSNGVVLMDGIEYLVTSNDFARMLKAVDRWTETAMTSESRLLISVDPRAFSDRELALLEKNKVVIKPSEDDGLDAVMD